MADYRTVTAVATVTQQTFNADGTVSETTFDVTAESPKVLAIDPYVTIEPIEDGAVITVTDAHGKTTATIYNGKDGAPGAKGERGEKGEKGDKGDQGIQGEPGAKGDKGADGAPGAKGDKGDTGETGPAGPKGDKGDKGDSGNDGADGADGADGFSPTATVSKSGTTTTITITDKNGTTTATVNDGVGDVASVNGKTGAVVLDADDVCALPDTVTIPTATSDLTNDSGYVDASGAASAAPVQSVNGQTGTVSLTIPTKTSELTNDSDFMSGMTILAYGKSTWNDFITAYNSRHVVYCRASSSSNPASGAQTRMAFMAYVNREVDPTEVEFQYYRSVSSHSATQQGDQVYVYKLNKTNGWTVTVREAYTRIVAGTGIKATYSSGILTIALDA